MSEVRIYEVKNPISEALLSKDGPTAARMVADADKRVALLADRIEAFVASRVALLATWTEQPEDALFSDYETLGRPSRDIAEVAEAAGMDTVGAVAQGLSVLLEGFSNRGIWHAEALRIHLRALALLHNQSPKPESADVTVVEELRALRLSLGLTD